MALLELRELPGRGLGAVAARAAAPGEVLLAERPLLLYPHAAAAAAVCAYCLRELALLPAPPAPCPSCAGAAAFCDARCAAAAAADPGSHCRAACALLAAADASGLDAELATGMQFLCRAAALAATAAGGDAAAAARLAALRALAPRGAAAPAAATAAAAADAAALHARLAAAAAAAGAAACPLSAPDAAALLERDAVNGYGFHLRFDPGAGAAAAPSSSPGASAAAAPAERRPRGAGLFAAAARVNHECLPNAARFDDLDFPFSSSYPFTSTCGFFEGGGAADGVDSGGAVVVPSAAAAAALAAAAPPGAAAGLRLRALHALPAGAEATAAYFPLDLPLAARRARCAELYGFACACPRCRLEAAWEARTGGGGGSEEDGMDAELDDEAATAAAAAADDEAAAISVEGVDAAYVHVFLTKFCCPRPGCGGAAAPPPRAPGLLECSACGARRTEAEFLAALEAGDGDSDDDM
jgi:hypothetical protein